MLQLAANIRATAAEVTQKWSTQPKLGVILGSGLGGLAEDLEVEFSIDYTDLPHFPQTSAIGHRGRLVCGTLDSIPLVVFQGRCHLYEGHSAQQTTYPVRLLQALGAKTLLVTNAAGGVNPSYKVGDIMVIEDQINLMFANPLVGINDENLGPRFPDMSAPYDPELIETVVAMARRSDFTLHRGVYLSMLGPTYETRAEYRMARRLGSDAVGMSTAPEVIAARHANMRVLGLATITNLGLPDRPSHTTGHDVIAAAETAADKISQIIRGVVATL